jgi:hypothetical protein
MAFMIDLLGEGRSWDLLSDNAAQCQKRPIAIGFGQRYPEICQGNSLIWLQRARGGTELGLVCRMAILHGTLFPGESGSNPPISGVPELRLWRIAARIDNAELRVWSVCFFCNCHKGPNIAGIDPRTRKIVPLFNPRRHKWSRHFHWDGPVLAGITPSGRATVRVLKINLDHRVGFRQELIDEGVFPPS